MKSLLRNIYTHVGFFLCASKAKVLHGLVSLRYNKSSVCDWIRFWVADL